MNKTTNCISEGEKQISAWFFANRTLVTKESIIKAYIAGINYAINAINPPKINHTSNKPLIIKEVAFKYAKEIKSYNVISIPEFDDLMNNFNDDEFLIKNGINLIEKCKSHLMVCRTTLNILDKRDRAWLKLNSIKRYIKELIIKNQIK